jgi:hypothetical protein
MGLMEGQADQTGAGWTWEPPGTMGAGFGARCGCLAWMWLWRTNVNVLTGICEITIMMTMLTVQCR